MKYGRKKTINEKHRTDLENKWERCNRIIRERKIKVNRQGMYQCTSGATHWKKEFYKVLQTPKEEFE